MNTALQLAINRARSSSTRTTFRIAKVTRIPLFLSASEHIASAAEAGTLQAQRDELARLFKAFGFLLILTPTIPRPHEAREFVGTRRSTLISVRL